MLAYSDVGDGSALVFLHGIGSNRHRWAPIVEVLADDFRCLTVDLPGHGSSPDDGCDLVGATVAVHQLVEYLGIVSPVIIGHSLGASAVLLYGALFGARSVVSIDPVGLYVPHLAASLAPFADRLQGQDFHDAFEQWEQQFRIDLVPEPLRSTLQTSTPPRQDVVLSYWRTALDPAACDAVQATFADTLASIKVPTLICLAEPPTAEDQAVLARMSTATVEVYEGLGHYLHLVDIKRFCTRLRAWVAEN